MSYPVLRNDQSFRFAAKPRGVTAMECDWCGGAGQVLVSLRKPHGSRGDGMAMEQQEEPCAKCDGRGTIEVRG